MRLILIVVFDSALSDDANQRWKAFITQRADRRLDDALVLASLSSYPADIEQSLKELAPVEDASDWVLCLLPATSPLFDDSLIAGISRAAAKYDRAYRPVGAIPGTHPILVTTLRAFRSHQTPYIFFWDSQRIYNTNLNIARAKREKLMSSLETALPLLHERCLQDVLDFLSSPQGVAFAISYGEQVELERYSFCPLCGSGDMQPVRCGSGHPTIGFLTAEEWYYNYCLDCTVVFLNPQMRSEDLWRYYDQAAYGAYTDVSAELHRLNNLTELNTAHLANYRAVSHLLKELKAGDRVMDLGAGGGEFCSFAKSLRPDLTVMAVDHRINDTLSKALHELGIDCMSGDFVPETLALPQASIITNWEVVEHIKLERLQMYFHRIANLLDHGGLYILSTPDFANYFTHALDFWAMAPGEHVSVLNRNVLEPLLWNAGLSIVEEKHECATMRIQNRWFAYGAANHASMASRAESQIIEDLLQQDEMREAFRQWMRANNLGSELILICKKVT
jgi:2-polyprenyl-3-methyl-5-hydroxy-6-metoxy-1,4-benzoquinol methylase